MDYTNYLTTPKGHYCEVKDITNGDYLILVKFLQAENYKKFFECLEEITRKSIPNFDEFDIIEKCYVFIAMCMYSIRGSISVNNTMIGSQQISLALILDNIEKSYSPDYVVQYKLNNGFVLKFGYPKTYTFQSETPVIDFYSGLIGYNDIVLQQNQKEQLKNKLGTRQLSFIDDFLRQKMVSICNIFDGVPMNKFQMNIVGQSLISNVIGFYKFPLDSFYKMMYIMVKHIRMSYSDFMKITHVQSDILLKCIAQENAKMTQEAKSGNIATIGRQLDD